MKKQIYIFLIIFSFSSLAHGKSLLQCFEYGQEYGQPQTNHDFFQYCYQVVKDHASFEQQFSHHDISFIAYQNMIYFKKMEKEEEKIYLISGEQSRLEEVHALFYDHKNNRLLALVNQERSIFTFHIDSGGNIAPIREIRHRELTRAEKISVDFYRDEIIVHMSDDRERISFKRKASIFSQQNRPQIMLREGF